MGEFNLNSGDRANGGSGGQPDMRLHTSDPTGGMTRRPSQGAAGTIHVSGTTSYDRRSPWRLLEYEFIQLQKGYLRLTSDYRGDQLSFDQRILKNALVESSLVHIRVITEFLYKGAANNRESNLGVFRASDTITDPAQNWDCEALFRKHFGTSGFTEFSSSDQSTGLYNRLSNDLAHLSAKRYEILDPSSSEEKLTPQRLVDPTIESVREYIQVFNKHGNTADYPKDSCFQNLETRLDL